VSEAIETACEAIAEGLYLEGLAIDHERDAIWYSDVIAGGVHGIRSNGTPITTINPQRMWTGGVIMNADGRVLSSGESGIMWNDPETGRSGWLIDTIDDRPINGVNEMVSDGAGGIVFGINDIERVIKGEATRPTALYRLTASRELVHLAGDIGFSNGIMYDPERARLYCNDTFRGTWGFDVATGFVLQNRALILDKEDADGMSIDETGNIWITGFRSSHFVRLAPDGTPLEPFEMGKGSITQLRFGGPDMRDIYFNSVPADGGDTLKEGGEITAKRSFLYCARSPIPGKRLQPAHFILD
jgi:sugar lactone lactonase YvrE